jgi:protoheme IX farnesyltransferase
VIDMSSPAAAAATAALPRPKLAIARDVLALTKPRLTLLVVCTAAGGMWLAPGRHEAVAALALLLGTGAVVGAANALNNYLEIDVDALMRRTRDRPLPAGRLDPSVAGALGIGLSSLALPALGICTNAVTAALAAMALFVYVGIYTPLKQHTTLALFVGAVPGAIPPLMGWTAVTGRVDAGGIALFALLFCWQLPHFLAISIYLKEDYARGGLRVFAVVHGERRAKLWIAGCTFALVAVSLLLVPLGLAGRVYAALALVSGVALCAYAVAGVVDGCASTAWARKFFLCTLVYLTLLFAVLIAGAR